MSRRLGLVFATAVLMMTSLVPAGAQGPLCMGKRATITGRGGALRGTAGSDVIVGGRGSDRINGNGGHDLICGGGGDDHLRGGDGAMTISSDGRAPTRSRGPEATMT
jgi:Ca2+-binding RTX toxin-like protein